jgi:hypothetical protein
MALECRLDLAGKAGSEGYGPIVAYSSEPQLHVHCSGDELASIRILVGNRGLEICSMFASPVTTR